MMILLLFVVLLFLIVALVRVELIFQYRIKRINFVSRKAKQAIDKCLPWGHLYDEFRCRSFSSMFFTPRKWRYKDFYNDESLL